MSVRYGLQGLKLQLVTAVLLESTYLSRPLLWGGDNLHPSQGQLWGLNKLIITSVSLYICIYLPISV